MILFNAYIPDTAKRTPFEYALLGENVVLYSDAQLTAPITSLPSTYFVIIIGEGDASYRVSYMDIDGYISKTAAEPVDYEPKYKYASAKFRVNNDGQAANVRSTPDHTQNNVVTSLVAGSMGIYYGVVRGSSLIPEVGDLWYYIRYSSQPYLYGYVYKSQLSVDPIEANVIERVEPEPEQTQTTDKVSYIIAGALTLPALIIMLFVFKKPSSTPRSRKSKG